MKQKKVNRRTFLKQSVQSLLVAGLFGSTYSMFGERFWYKINHIQLPLEHLPNTFQDWRIIQFSDVHYGFHFDKEHLEKLVQHINHLQPDIIFFTGDLVQTKFPTPQEMIPTLRKLRTPRGGKWAVVGNHDYVFQRDVIETLHASDFTVLQNEHRRIQQNDESLYIAGLDDALYGIQDLAKTREGLRKDDCILLLAHEPDVAVATSVFHFQAQFSGHSHGGQVRLPFIGPIISQQLAETYNDGLYYVGKNKMPLYVNRGIGTTQLPIRLFCRPEITVFHITKK